MKFITVVVLVFTLAGCDSTNSKSEKELALEFLHLSKFEETINATIQEYESQLTSDATPEVKNIMHQMLTDALGWEATKEQLLEIVSTTYTKEELAAQIEYIKTPQGQSFTAKNGEFAKKYSALISENLKKMY